LLTIQSIAFVPKTLAFSRIGRMGNLALLGQSKRIRHDLTCVLASNRSEISLA